MSETDKEQQAIRARKIWVLYLGSFSLILLSKLLGCFNRTTELFPAHPAVDQACFILSIVGGVLALAAGIYLCKGLSIVQRVMLPFVFMLLTGGGVFLITNEVTSMVEGRIDFPAGKTHTHQVLMLISRAYQTHGKGHSQYIQTMPVWSNLEITAEDFAFMQQHRRADDDGKNADEIRSRGYFCAKVAIEQTDSAVRILHAGDQELPKGTVILCPVLSRVQ